MNTHYAVIYFSGDPAGEHPDSDLNGQAPHLNFIGSGDEEFCWRAVNNWTEKHPLRTWEHAEVLTRTMNVTEGTSK